MHSLFQSMIAGTQDIPLKAHLFPQSGIDLENANQIKIINGYGACYVQKFLCRTVGVHVEIAHQFFVVGLDPDHLDTLQRAGGVYPARQGQQLGQGIFMTELEYGRTTHIPGDTGDPADNRHVDGISRKQSHITTFVAL